MYKRKLPNLAYLWKIFWYIKKKDSKEQSPPDPLRPPFLAMTCFFFNHFEELQSVLTEVKLIINNAPLTYVYPNTIKTCLTPNHSLFDRQLLYYSNTTSTVVRNLIVLSSTTDKINRSNHFWDRWRHEYVVNLCEKQPTSKPNVNSQKIILC